MTTAIKCDYVSTAQIWKRHQLVANFPQDLEIPWLRQFCNWLPWSTSL
jgi:hypothetical protein